MYTIGHESKSFWAFDALRHTLAHAIPPVCFPLKSNISVCLDRPTANMQKTLKDFPRILFWIFREDEDSHVKCIFVRQELLWVQIVEAR